MVTFIFVSQQTDKKIWITIGDIKSGYILVVESAKDFYLVDKKTKEEFDLTWNQEPQDLLDALNLKIESRAPANSKRKNKNDSSIVIMGNVTGSHIVMGNDNVATNTHDGLTVTVIGDNLFVGPK